MSNALAIAHVTQALALLIETNLPPDIDMAVKVEPRKPPADPPTEPTITVFLYQVTPNTSQRNTDLPTRASDGTLVRRAVAPLDLHYLISAYGEEAELVGQRLIGSVVRTLHEIPVLPKDIIELAGERPWLSGSDLAQAVQRVRFTPTVMDIDETSKLWGMLHQTPYTLSVAYQAALVLIDGREVPVPGKPVERPEVRVLPFGAPGAPVPPGAEPPGTGPSGPNPPTLDPSTAGPAEATAPGASGQAPAKSAAAGTPGRAPAKTVTARTPGTAPADAVAEPPAKAVTKAPARTRKAAQPARTTKAAKSPKPASASKTARPARTVESPKNTDGGEGDGGTETKSGQDTEN